MNTHNTHMLRMAAALFKAADALRADTVEVQARTNYILEHAVYYMNNGLVFGSESETARTMFAGEMEAILSPTYDPSASSNGATLSVPVDEGYYDNDYRYEYYLFYRNENDELQVDVLDAPPAGGYPRNLLLGDRNTDVVVVHLTLASSDNHCVNLNTYRVKPSTKENN